MSSLSSPFERLGVRVLTGADALANRLYGQRYNPLYQSGTIVVALYLVLVITGLWLLLFYRVGAPWQSVAHLTASPWTGRWVRGLHRYATDLALVATAVHAFRMFAQGRSWGARTLAWVSGCVLLLLVLLCGWTGYVMVWDTFGGHLAAEGARMLDALPLLSEPTSRAFTGETPVPTAFFFLNLFAHIGLPLGMGVIFWLHVKRLARPAMLPSRPLMWGAIAALTAAAILWPVPMAPEADPLRLPEQVPADLFIAFWIPISRRLQGGQSLLLAIVIGTLLCSVPWITARRGGAAPASHVDEDICVGCVQCSLDCPYGAITMLPRDSKRSPLVARVDPGLCVSCGICSGSCPPMGVGPPGRTGRDQLLRARAFISEEELAGQIVVVACGRGAGTYAGALEQAGARPYVVSCAGNLHTSVIEQLLRGGAGGVLILSCPPRDCWNREGPRWLGERMYHGREAELQERVDRARIHVAAVNAAERRQALSALAAFAAEIAALEVPVAKDDDELSSECEPPDRGDEA
jgi:coenzyme F420-reducing hydrogenase delta subunit/Pyruvate/2-oxoacid:ferredoxin oxidoreductase delta subunit